MITVVSDSSIALTKKEASVLGVSIVPMTYTIEGQAFYERCIDEAGAYDKIGLYPCATSQPSVAAFASVFKNICAQGKQVLCLTISSRLSGTYSSAMIAAKETDEANIKVVDTRTSAGGIRLLAEYANELIGQNVPLDDIITALERKREDVNNVFSVENMEPLRRSGRLGFVRQSVSAILNIRPVLQIRDGALVCCGFTKGKRNQNEKILQQVPSDVKKIIVQHLGKEDAARELCDMIEKKFPFITPVITTVGPVLAIHIGIPAIGLSWIV